MQSFMEKTSRKGIAHLNLLLQGRLWTERECSSRMCEAMIQA